MKSATAKKSGTCSNNRIIPKIFMSVFLLFGLMQLAAQEPIEVVITEHPSSFGVKPAFEVVVPQATPREAIDLWKKTIAPWKLFGRSPKMKKVEDEWIVNNVLIDDISSRPLDVITQVSSFPGNIYVHIFMRSENGFIGAPDSLHYTDELTAEYIREYAVELYRQAVDQELDEEEDELHQLEREMRKLERKHKRYATKMGDALKDKSELRGEAGEQKAFLEETEFGEGENEAGEALKDELKSTEKEIKKARRTESRMKRKIRKNERDQREIARKIEEQEIRVEEVSEKLGNIR
jgi:hypothetical protein